MQGGLGWRRAAAPGLGKLAAGVRVLVLSDSCHSGTAVRAVWYRWAAAARAGAQQVRYRAIPPDAALRTYRLHRAFYDRILAGLRRGEARKEAAASILLISGCQDNQLSQDGEVNGLFTGRASAGGARRAAAGGVREAAAVYGVRGGA